MSTLYRKYRPQKWADVAGQHHVKVTLAFEAQTGRVAHAYLFSGPRGTGKTTVARLFARAINCIGRVESSELPRPLSSVKEGVVPPKEAGKVESSGKSKTFNSKPSTLNSSMGEPCGKCKNCLLIDSGAALDLIEVDAASHTGVDNVRENIIESARFAPAQLPYKVFVIDEVHMLSTAAFNALLKTLEEPPAKTVFILATTELHKVPATVLSRCQRFDFRKIPFTEAVERLKAVAAQEGKKVDRKVLEEIARHADGGLRDAEGLLGKVLSSVDEKQKEISYDEASVVLPRSDEALVAAFVEGLLRRDAAAAVTAVQAAADTGVDMDHFASESVEALRRALLASLGVSLETFAAELDESRRAQVEAWGKLGGAPQIILALETLMEKRRDLKNAHLPTLPLELAAARVCTDIPSTVSQSGSVLQSIPSGGSDVRYQISDISSKSPSAVPHATAATPNLKTTTPPNLSTPTTPARGPGSTSLVESSELPRPLSSVKEGGVPPKEAGKVESSAANSQLSTLNSQPLVSIESVRTNWKACIAKAGESNGSLTFLLSVAEPLHVDGNCVHVGFGFAFHRDKFNEAKTKDVVARAFSEVLGQNLACHGSLLDKNTVLGNNNAASAEPHGKQPAAAQADPMIAAFGGQRIA